MKTENKTSQLFDALAEKGISVPEEYRRKITERIDAIVSYTPTVGVFGKTGAGKSSLCNALFGQDVCPVSAIDPCTRTPQQVELGVGAKSLTLLDVPGVGESRERDQEYARLYSELLPKLDLVLWVLKGDDRAFASDESFYRGLVAPYVKEGTPFFFVINQVDKIEPFREWNEAEHRPGSRQATAIDEKRRSVSGFFDQPLDRVLPVSAAEQYGLIDLVDAVIHALPREKRVSVLREVRAEHRSERAREEAGNGLLDTFVDLVVDFVPVIPSRVKEAVKTVAKAVVGKVCSWFSSWFD